MIIFKGEKISNDIFDKDSQCSKTLLSNAVTEDGIDIFFNDLQFLVIISLKKSIEILFADMILFINKDYK